MGDDVDNLVRVADLEPGDEVENIGRITRISFGNGRTVLLYVDQQWGHLPPEEHWMVYPSAALVPVVRRRRKQLRTLVIEYPPSPGWSYAALYAPDSKVASGIVVSDEVTEVDA